MIVGLFAGLLEGSVARHSVLAIAGATVIGVAIWFWPAGHRGFSGRDVPVVYVCTETEETFSDRYQSVPALNPKTGRRTLVRGIYCPECGRWFASPPISHQSANPREHYCPVHHVVMTYDGPLDGHEGSATAQP